MREILKITGGILMLLLGLSFVACVNLALYDWITTPRCCEHCPAPAREPSEDAR